MDGDGSDPRGVPVGGREETGPRGPVSRPRDTRDSSAPTLRQSAPGAEPPERLPTPPPQSPAASRPVRTIGPYRVLDQIGEGGMGTVYLAEQSAPIKRRVAIKVIRAGMDSHEIIARFDTERRTLALMSHPNIAQILDAGETEEGRPYFVMEYVPGISLTDYCDLYRVSLDERLGLLEEVCGAVQHAHLRGIIHRDLKPWNVLVNRDGDRPIPKVIDFGIAKATEQVLGDPMKTREGSLVGTPEYASPEQLGTGETEVDTRADVYSLGVILYELAAGVPPFAFRGRSVKWPEIQRTVREVEPVAPSRALALAENLEAVAARRGSTPAGLLRKVRGELDWIVLKAIEKEPARRYQTPAALAADLRRLRDDEPVEASPPSLTYRLRKLVRRHLAASVAVTAAVVAIAVSGALFTVRLAAERDNATRQARLAIAARDRAVAARDFLLGVVQSTNPYQSPNPARRVDTLFESAARSLAGRFPNDPEMEAQLLQQFGRSLMALERDEAAGEALERAESLLSGRVADTHPVLVETRGRLVDLFRLRRDYARASALAERQLALCREGAGLSPVTCLAVRNDRIEVTMTTDAAGAMAEVEEAFAFARRTGSEADYEAVFTDYLAGRVLRDLGRAEESARAILRLVDRTLRAVSDRHPGLLTDVIWLGWTAYDLGDPGLARRCAEYALSGRRALYGEATRYYYEVVQQRGIVALASGDRTAAAADFRFLLERIPPGERTLAAFRESAQAWLALADEAHARALDLAALEAEREKAVGRDAAGMADIRLLLAAVALTRGEPGAAAGLLERARRGSGVAGRPYLAPLALVLEAHVARAGGRTPESARLLAEAERLLAAQGRRLFDPVAARWVGAEPRGREGRTAALLEAARRIGERRGSRF